MPIWRGTTNTDWNTASNWIVDGSGNSGVPTSTTDAIFDSGAVNDCVLGAERFCRDLIFTAFPSVYTVNLSSFVLNVYRNVTLQSDISSRVIGTTGTLRMSHTSGGTAVNGTITPNGGTWPLNFLAGSAGILITLAADFTINGNAQIQAVNFLTNRLLINGNFTASSGGGSTTTNIVLIGSGTITMTGSFFNLEIDSPMGTYTILSPTLIIGRRFVITSIGTLNNISTTNIDFNPWSAVANVIDLGGRTIQDFRTTSGTQPTTILSSFTCRDISLLSAAYNGPASPSTATITITRNYNITNLVTSTNGTLLLEMNAASGAGAIASGARVSRLPLNINAGSNTITYNGNYTIENGAIFTRTSGNINPGTTTVTQSSLAAATISNIVFWNLVLNAGSTMIQNDINTIQNTLTCNGSATFQGTHGFVTNNFTCTTAASTITLQNINANPLAEYRITGLLTLIGTLASRITLQAAGFATFTGTINPVGQLNIASGTAPSIGMTISQATGISPNGLIGLLPNRPVITGGTNPTFTISPSATVTLGSTSMRAGFKAKFILENNGVATQNVGYVTTQDIDSSDGQTILSFGSNQDDVSTNVSLFRTLNWGPLFASSGSTAYTWVD